jgi:hypothetical protein
MGTDKMAKEILKGIRKAVKAALANKKKQKKLSK